MTSYCACVWVVRGRSNEIIVLPVAINPFSKFAAISIFYSHVIQHVTHRVPLSGRDSSLNVFHTSGTDVDALQSHIRWCILNVGTLIPIPFLLSLAPQKILFWIGWVALLGIFMYCCTTAPCSLARVARSLLARCSLLCLIDAWEITVILGTRKRERKLKT